MSRPLSRVWLSLGAAALIGIAQTCLLTVLWGYISAYTPLPMWLLTLGLRGTALHAAVFLSDSLLNIIFCLPAGYAICRLKPSRLPVYLIVAILPGLIWQYRLFFTGTFWLKNWAMFAPGVLLALLPLPLAALLLSRVLVHRAPNNRWRGP
jgi:hypothetical protein